LVGEGEVIGEGLTPLSAGYSPFRGSGDKITV
jgi:hypothetical protein